MQNIKISHIACKIKYVQKIKRKEKTAMYHVFLGKFYQDVHIVKRRIISCTYAEIYIACLIEWRNHNYFASWNYFQTQFRKLQYRVPKIEEVANLVWQLSIALNGCSQYEWLDYIYFLCARGLMILIFIERKMAESIREMKRRSDIIANNQLARLLPCTAVCIPSQISLRNKLQAVSRYHK